MYVALATLQNAGQMHQSHTSTTKQHNLGLGTMAS